MFTSVGGTMAPSVLRDLRRSQRLTLRLIGADRVANPIAARFLDGFVQVPSGSDPDYLDCMLDAVRAHGVDVLVPWSDEESLAVASAYNRFVALGCTPLVSPPEVLATICDKQKTYDQMRSAGLRTTDYRLTTSVNDALACLRDYDVPRTSGVVKPPGGRGGRGLVFVEGADNPPDWLGGGARERRVPVTSLDDPALRAALDTTLADGGGLLVMRSLHAPVYDVDLLAKDGEVVALVVRRRHNPAGIPFTGNTIIADPEIERYCRSVAEVMRLNSLHDLDLMTDCAGQVVLLEINPRMSGSIAASVAAGIPFLEMALAQAAGLSMSWDWSPPHKDIDVLPVVQAVVV